MEICVLASGSSGNCTCISSKNTTILFDVGISLRTLKKNLSYIGKSPEEVTAVFVSHEHMDHIKGIPSFSKNYGAPIYLTPGTYASMPYLSNAKLIELERDYAIGDFSVNTLKTSHDAASPCGFLINSGNKRCGIFTDLGVTSEKIESSFKELDAAVLETNHDVDTLLNGNYPYHLKQRILGDKGHLSNIDAGLLVRNNASEQLKTVFLAHLSQNNNTPELALNTFETLSKQNKLLRHNSILTSQYKPTDLIDI
ncbi:MAG: MBL fold metallo-hydrolase [archaeon]